MTWTVDIGTAGSAFTEEPQAYPLFFVQRLNGVGFHSVLIANPQSNPSREDVVRFTWDKGGANETVHYEGFLTDIRRRENSNVFTARGLSLEGLLWQSTVGGVRDYDSVEPWDILQQTGTPNGLLFNSQGNRKPIGGTTVQAGTSSSVPNKITSGSQGRTMSFRADSHHTWRNIQRLLLQGRHANAEYPSWVAAGDDFGLEGFVQLEDADGDGDTTDPRAYLVSRREPTANATPTTITYPDELHNMQRGEEGLTAAEALRVVGSGDGRNRVETGSIVGSGGLEGILADKTVRNSTNASNMAERLRILLDPTTEVVTAWSGAHGIDWTPGHRFTIQEPGVSDATLRLFTSGYHLSRNAFFLTFGRPRPLPNDPFSSLGGLAGGQAHGPQQSDAHAAVLSTQPATNGTVTTNNGDTTSVTLNFNTRTYDPTVDHALSIHVQMKSDATGSLDGNDSTIRIAVQDTSTATNVLNTIQTNIPDAETLNIPVYVASEQAVDFWGSGTLSDLKAVAQNLSGTSETRDITLQLSAWVKPET